MSKIEDEFYAEFGMDKKKLPKNVEMTGRGRRSYNDGKLWDIRMILTVTEAKEVDLAPLLKLKYYTTHVQDFDDPYRWEIEYIRVYN
jgi:hypothetical protein